MSVRIQRVCPLAVIKQQGLSVLSYFSTCGLRGVWFSCLVFSGPSDAVEDSADGAFPLLRAIRNIIGLDFVVTLSSLDSFCVRFDITSQQLIELKWLILNKHNRWFHSSRVKFLLVRMSASWFFGVNVFDLDFWVQIDSIEQPIKSNSVGSGYVSHCGISSFYDHFDHCFVVFKHIQQSFLMRRVHVRGNKINSIQIIDHSLRLFTLCLRPWFVWEQTTGLTVLSWFWVEFQRTKTIRSHKSRAGIPSDLNLASKEMILILLNCETEVCFLHIQLIGTNVWLPKNVEEFFSARRPSSSAEVRRLVIHDIKEVEGVRQHEEQEYKRDEEIIDEVNGEVEEITHRAHETWGWVWD